MQESEADEWGRSGRVKHIEGNSVDGVVDEFFFYSEISVICRELYIGKSLQV